MKTFDGREKSLLRAATRNLLPPAIAQRVKSPYPSTQDPHYTQALRTGLRAVLRDGDAPVQPLLDAAVVAQASAADASQDIRPGAELVLGLNDWLRRYNVALEI